MLDVYQPAGATMAPVVMVVHGGAWMIGDKQKAEAACTVVAMSGMVAVACNYELSPLPLGGVRQALWWSTVCGPLVMLPLGIRRRAIVMYVALTFVAWLVLYTVMSTVSVDCGDNIQKPSHIGDVETVLDWVERRISSYGGDPARVVLLGHSAGAHLASLLSMRRMEAPTRSPVLGVVCISGVYSQARLREVTCGDWLTACAFGKQDNYARFFPVHNVTSAVPPHFLINAEWDFSLIKHTWDLAATLTANGVYVRFKYFAGNHFSIMRNWDNNRNSGVWRAVHSFIQEAVETRYDATAAGSTKDDVRLATDVKR